MTSVRRSYALLAVAVSVAGLAVVVGLLAAPRHRSVGRAVRTGGQIYYVSPHGSDSAAGTSPSHAWRTVDQVNRAPLRPGDVVLFRGGATYGATALMPGWGTAVSGTSEAPIVFASYGSGQASLPDGVWIEGESDLRFENLELGPRGGIAGTGHGITVADCTIHDIMTATVPNPDVQFGIVVSGSQWTITGNTIDRTGSSGMLIAGSDFVVEDNRIENTGLNPLVTWGAHGIYDKVIGATITHNTIVHFRNEGISARYRASTIMGNTISGGQYGIGFHQYDTRTGLSRWTGNTISDTSIVGIYISRHDVGGITHENFVIARNRVTPPHDPGDWVAYDLHTTGTVRGAPAVLADVRRVRATEGPLAG